jgi:extracellular factor (EF) 3-hydroxypalmitic acid methyl ester biosynthesis protein
MGELKDVFEGVLSEGDMKVPVQARFASRYSLWVAGNGNTMDGISNLSLAVEDRIVDIGPCRLVEDTEEPSATDPAWRRLVPMEHVHDFEKLLFHAKKETLQQKSMNLPLILGYKNKIDLTFRHFVSDLTYDLSVYCRLFDQLDAEYRDEAPSIASSIQESIIQTTGKSLQSYLDVQRRELERIVEGFNDTEHEHHGYYFRRQLWNTLVRAPIMARTNLKPRGYNGDSEMMRMIYQNGYVGESTFGKILHKYAVGQQGAEAVRNRRQDVAGLLRDYAATRAPAGPERLRVLSVACGPCFELRDILSTPQECRRVHFSLFDQDQQALLEAAMLIAEIENTQGARVSVDFIKESVRTMIVGKALAEKWGRFNFIYSMGLFDYLTFPVAVAVMSKLYQLLVPGGEMVIGNFHVSNQSRVFMEYWLDWKIIHRSEEDFLRMTESLPGARVQLHFDASRIQMLLHVTKGDENG